MRHRIIRFGQIGLGLICTLSGLPVFAQDAPPQSPAAAPAAPSTAIPAPAPNATTPTAIPAPAPPTRPVIHPIAHAPIRLSNEQGWFDYMTIDPGEQHVFAAHPSAGKLAVLNLDSDRARQFETGAVTGVAVDGDDGKVFMAGADQRLRVVDRQSLVKIDEFVLDGKAGFVAYNSDNHRIYVDHAGLPDVWVFDAKTHQQIATISVNGSPGQMVYDPGTRLLFQTIGNKDRVDVIEPNSNRVIGSWLVDPGARPTGIAVDSQLHLLFVACGNGQLICLDSRSGALLGSVEIAKDVDQIAYDPFAQKLFCASGTGVVSVVGVTRSGISLIGDFATASGAHSLALNRTSKTIDVWTAYSNSAGSYFQCFGFPR